MSNVIKVENLSKEFKQYNKLPGLIGSIKSLFSRDYSIKKAVDQINFEIQEGEIVGFIGPNGAGKTTTLKMLSGLLHPTSGTINVLGYKPYERKNDFKKQYSLVMGQKSQLWPDLPPMETFNLNRKIYEISQNEFNKIVEELSELLKINDILRIQVRRLSLGQRMKCEILASLLHTPKLLFLDEPTIGLDIVIQKRLRQFLKEYNKKFNSTILLTSHYMDDVKELAKRLIIISEGKVIYDDTLDNLTKKYAEHKYLKLIFSKEVNKTDLLKYGEIIEYEGLTTTISVNRANHTLIASQILSHLPVEDIDIQETKLEDIISKIYISKQK